MIDNNRILGLFYSDQDNLIYQKVKGSENLSEENKNLLNMLSFKFLGPVFLTDASATDDPWKIEIIESSLILTQSLNVDLLQSFFALNSSRSIKNGMTHLFAIVGSDHTEDIKDLHNILTRYVHSSIIQGDIVNEDLLGSNFNRNKFINEELNRGIRLVGYSLGSSRKVYWEEKHEYFCAGILERIKSVEKNSSYLYTFNVNDSLRTLVLSCIPSFYILTILPAYYENLISETLRFFKKDTVLPNIRLLSLCNKKNKIIYLEETNLEHNLKRSYGAILIENMDNNQFKNCYNLSYFKKNLRQLLDNQSALNERVRFFNPNFENSKWSSSTEEDLNNIKFNLDIITN